MGRGLLVVEHAPLGAGLDDHHRHVVGDHVVQLARDPGPFLDDGLTSRDVALALGEPYTALAVADDDGGPAASPPSSTTANCTPCCSDVRVVEARRERPQRHEHTRPNANAVAVVQTASAYNAQKQAIVHC